MNQAEFKEELFTHREELKEKLTNIYNSKKLLKMFLAIFGKVDYLTFNKLPANEQRELVEKVFGSPELVFGNIEREELLKAKELADKRIKGKQTKEAK